MSMVLRLIFTDDAYKKVRKVGGTRFSASLESTKMQLYADSNTIGICRRIDTLSFDYKQTIFRRGAFKILKFSQFL